MQFEFTTFNAAFEPDAGDYYYPTESGTVTLYYGDRNEVISWKVAGRDADWMTDNNDFSSSKQDAQDNVNAFVATKFGELFKLLEEGK